MLFSSRKFRYSVRSTIRNIIGSIDSTPIGDISLQLTKDTSNCSNVVKVVATATDGTTVIDDSLENCVFVLPLVIGKSYVISFVDYSDGFIASLVGSSGSIFLIGDGTETIDLSVITISDGSATYAGESPDFAPVTCVSLGYIDSNDDGICDAWDGGVPDSEAMLDKRFDIPIITSVTTDVDTIQNGGEITVTIIVESMLPLDFVMARLTGPLGSIYGGGSGGKVFTEIGPNMWRYSWTDQISPYAPSGDYYYSAISVETRGGLKSDVFPGPYPAVQVTNEHVAHAPDISSVSVVPSSITNGGTFTLSIEVTSDTPMDMLMLVIVEFVVIVPVTV